MCTFLAVLDIMLLVVMHHYTVQVVAVGNGDVSKSSSLNGSLGSKSSTTSITANEDGSNTFKYSGKYDSLTVLPIGYTDLSIGYSEITILIYAVLACYRFYWTDHCG